MTTLSPAHRVSSAGDLPIGDFHTEAGAVVSRARLRYRVYGDAGLGKSTGWNLVFHALTGSHEVDRWWGPLLAKGAPLDPARRPLVAANLLGSCYGSSGPAPGDRPDPLPFPSLTTQDLARAHEPLLAHLGVERVALATGGSLGGMVALQWARVTRVSVDVAVVFAAPAATSAVAIAWNAAQRMAIEADARWRGGYYPADDGPEAGLAAARAIAMITYRSAGEFAERFGRREVGPPGSFVMEHYLRHQGKKLVDRFDAASYLSLMRSMDLHDVGPLETAARDTAHRVRRLIGVGIDSDALYDPAEVAAWVAAYRHAGLRAEYREIISRRGHDAFLLEWEQVRTILEDAQPS